LLQRVQARFLKELFQSSKGGFVLKGGMALAALFGGSRQTRDIDLDFPPPGDCTADSLHHQVNRALEQALRGTGITDARVNKPGTAELSPKWKVSGIAPGGAPFHLKVEVSRRPPPPGGVRQAAVSGVAAFGIGTYYVDLYDERTLAAMKLAALLGRTAVRDVWDLDLLLPLHAPATPLIAWALEHSGVTAHDASKAVMARLASMDWNLFETQMLADDRAMATMRESSWAETRGRVGRMLGDVLDDHALRTGAA
jgi:hypothetical protein